jgi:radical SAM superfamily enzyme
MMLDTARYLNKLDIQGIKIHMLYIVKNTPIYRIYEKKPFPLLSMKDYVDIVVSQLTLINDQIIVHRLTGDPEANALIEPKWSLKKFIIVNEIDKLMRKNKVYQGSNC